MNVGWWRALPVRRTPQNLVDLRVCQRRYEIFGDIPARAFSDDVSYKLLGVGRRDGDDRYISLEARVDKIPEGFEHALGDRVRTVDY